MPARSREALAGAGRLLSAGLECLPAALGVLAALRPPNQRTKQAYSSPHLQSWSCVSPHMPFTHASHRLGVGCVSCSTRASSLPCKP